MIVHRIGVFLVLENVCRAAWTGLFRLVSNASSFEVMLVKG